MPVRSTYRDAPPGITLEEFGVNLFTVIKTIGSFLAVEEHRAVAIHRGQASAIPALLMQRARLQRQLATHLQALTDQEMWEILAAYPWVVHV